jgi:hypothetical protein
LSHRLAQLPVKPVCPVTRIRLPDSTDSKSSLPVSLKKTLPASNPIVLRRQKPTARRSPLITGYGHGGWRRDSRVAIADCVVDKTKWPRNGS